MVLKPCKSWDKLPSPQLVSLPDLWLPSTVGGRWQPVLYLPKTILISRVWSPWALSCRTSSSLCVFKGSSTFRPVTEVCLSNLFLDMYIYIHTYIHIYIHIYIHFRVASRWHSDKGFVHLPMFADTEVIRCSGHLKSKRWVGRFNKKSKYRANFAENYSTSWTWQFLLRLLLRLKPGVRPPERSSLFFPAVFLTYKLIQIHHQKKYSKQMGWILPLLLRHKICEPPRRLNLKSTAWNPWKWCCRFRLFPSFSFCLKRLARQNSKMDSRGRIFDEFLPPFFHGEYDLSSWSHAPYHPCMVYLPTFGWFLWYM